MHTSTLTPGSYTQGAEVGDAETGATTYFQDCAVSAATIADGTLHQRFDVIAYPQRGKTYTGTDSSSIAVPAPAVVLADTSH